MIMNLLMKFSGLGWVWDKVDGYKTFLSAAVSILAGLSGLASEAVPLLLAHNSSGILDMLKSLPKDPAFLVLMVGLHALGIGHKLLKAQNAQSAPSAQ